MTLLILGVILGIAIAVISFDRLLRWNDANKHQFDLSQPTFSNLSRSRQGRKILLNPRHRNPK